jgi:hypothetical protein
MARRTSVLPLRVGEAEVAAEAEAEAEAVHSGLPTTDREVRAVFIAKARSANRWGRRLCDTSKVLNERNSLTPDTTTHTSKDTQTTQKLSCHTDLHMPCAALQSAGFYR